MAFEVDGNPHLFAPEQCVECGGFNQAPCWACLTFYREHGCWPTQYVQAAELAAALCEFDRQACAGGTPIVVQHRGPTRWWWDD